MSVLVVDVGTSGLRAAVVRPDATIAVEHYRELLPAHPADGMVEFDAAAMAQAVLDVAHRALDDAGPVDAVGITNQRASTIVWDRATGEPVGPGIGWQDLRTVFTCLELRGQGVLLAPNESATKLGYLLDAADPDRSRDLAFGTVDTWVAWTLSGGAVHATDHTNAGVTGLRALDGLDWNRKVLHALNIPDSCLPAVQDSASAYGEARALPGGPPITALVGDQQGSLVGQGCLRPGLAKATFGTGAMLDVCTGEGRPHFDRRGGHGVFPVVAWSRGGRLTWGVEAVMLSAGTCISWLRDDLGLIDTPAQSHDVAARCATSDGVVFVPALMGLGAPHWDYGARGTLLGLTSGSGRPQIVRAVLEGIALRGADLAEAAEADGGVAIRSLRVDGGMSENPTFVQALADATGRPIELSPVRDATTLGAGFLAGLATGAWQDEDDIAAAWQPREVVEPAGSLDREQWKDAVRRAGGWLPDLSALEF